MQKLVLRSSVRNLHQVSSHRGQRDSPHLFIFSAHLDLELPRSRTHFRAGMLTSHRHSTKYLTLSEDNTHGLATLYPPAVFAQYYGRVSTKAHDSLVNPRRIVILRDVLPPLPSCPLRQQPDPPHLQEPMSTPTRTPSPNSLQSCTSSSLPIVIGTPLVVVMPGSTRRLNPTGAAPFGWR